MDMGQKDRTECLLLLALAGLLALLDDIVTVESSVVFVLRVYRHRCMWCECKRLCVGEY